MDKIFSPADIEARWYEHWEASGYFAPQGGDTSFCIPIPPPNVTGSLHMGHGFQQAIMDALIRYHRMTAKTPYGRWAPITRALRRKCWLNGNWKHKEHLGTHSGERRSSKRFGSGKQSPEAISPGSCGD